MTQPARVYEFGEFKLDASERVLLNNGRPLSLTPKCFDLLVALVENAGRLLPKEELISRVWPDSFIEENGLNRNIYLLRKALGKDGSGTGFIETVPKHGYRFTAEVARAFESDAILVVEKHTEAEIVTEEVSDSGATELYAAYSMASPPAAAVGSLSRTARLRGLTLPITVSAGFLAIATIVYLLADGRFGRAETSSPVRSIAVLPFKTIGVNEDPGARGLGIADMLITRLSNIKELNVRPTSTVTQFENREQDSLQIGRDLQVDAVLEGSIYHADDKVLVTVRLVKVSDQSPIWAGQFEQPLGDELRLQDEIALQVADSLELNLSGVEKRALTKRYTQSRDAYQLYLKGRYRWSKRDNEGLEQAERLFRDAIDMDPNFALAYVGVADKWIFGADPGEAGAFVQKALEIDPNLGEAYATRGFLSMFHGWDWVSAEADFKRAIELNPGYPTAHQWYATFLMIRGRLDEAKAELRRALEINPKSHNLLADLGHAHYFAREFDIAKQYCDKAQAIHPGFLFAHRVLKDVCFQTGEYEKAIEQLGILNISLTTPSLPNLKADETTVPQDLVACYTEAYRKDGVKGFWKLYLKACLESQDKNPNRFLATAQAYLSLGEKDKALDNLERAHERKAFFMVFVNADPVYESLRSEPRFQSLLHRMGLAS